MIHLHIENDAHRQFGEHWVEVVCRLVHLRATKDATLFTSAWEIVSGGGADDGKLATTMLCPLGSQEHVHAAELLGEDVTKWPGKRARMLSIGQWLVLTTAHAPTDELERERPRHYSFIQGGEQRVEASVLPDGEIVLGCRASEDADAPLLWSQKLTTEAFIERWAEFLDVHRILRDLQYIQTTQEAPKP